MMKAGLDSQKNFGRFDNTEKLRTYMRDDENTMMYRPEDYTGNKFFGQWNKLMNLSNAMFHEPKEKYFRYYASAFKAELENESRPICFNECVKDVTTGLDSREKNCMRECYFKRITTIQDFNMYMQQKMALENAKEIRERFV